MKIYDIVVPKKYMKGNEEKTSYSNVGKLIKFEATGDKPEGFIIELNMYPNNDFKVFEQKSKEQTSPAGYRPAPKDAPVPLAQGVEYPEDIHSEDIPF